jgi:hypothetical protein
VNIVVPPARTVAACGKTPTETAGGRGGAGIPGSPEELLLTPAQSAWKKAANRRNMMETIRMAVFSADLKEIALVKREHGPRALLHSTMPRREQGNNCTKEQN